MLTPNSKHVIGLLKQIVNGQADDQDKLAMISVVANGYGLVKPNEDILRELVQEEIKKATSNITQFVTLTPRVNVDEVISQIEARLEETIKSMENQGGYV